MALLVVWNQTIERETLKSENELKWPKYFSGLSTEHHKNSNFFHRKVKIREFWISQGRMAPV